MGAVPKPGDPFPLPVRMVAGLVGGAKALGLSRPFVRLVLRNMLAGKSRERAFAGYLPTRQDVFVATFGKSGTNWMMQIATQIAHRGEAEFEHIHELVPWPDAPPGIGAGLSDMARPVRSPTGLRVIKTHLEADLVPYAERAVYLTVLRDPKEVLVSAYYFLGGLLGVLDHLDFDDWLALSIEPGAMVDAWARHTAGFWSWRDRRNVLVLGYPEVLADPRRCIEGVAAVMGVDLREAELARVVERSSFAYMKAHASQFDPPPTPFARAGGRPQMIRRGKSGGSDELLTADQQAGIDRLCEAALARLGSDFPYPERFGGTQERLTRPQ